MVEADHEIWVTINGERLLVQVGDLHQRPVIAYVEGRRFEIELDEGIKAPGEVEELVEEGSRPHSIPGETSCEITSPMPGDITQVLVQAGQVVKAGDPLCILDAMKMKNTIHAPSNGVISEIFVSEGQSVEYGVPLFKMG
jgi:biotin carboxyl carrier protein